MKVLDLFCGAGGAAMGIHRALPEAEIIGVDNRFQKHYPFTFVLADAMNPPFDLREFDFIWASPPCQFYSECTPRSYVAQHPDLIGDVRKMLEATGGCFVIENVEMARHVLRPALSLCGSMFGLPIFRHRYFETNYQGLWLVPPHRHDFNPIKVSGMSSTRRVNGKRYKSPIAEKRKAMKIDWMTTSEITEAIPPAYSEFILKQIFPQG